MSIRTANGPSFVGCHKIKHLIDSGPDAIQEWLDGAVRDDDRPLDYNGWSGIAFQLAHEAHTSETRERALAFGQLACHVYEEILPEFQNELACVGLGCDGPLTEVEGMQLRVKMIARFGQADGVELLDPCIVAGWFDCCSDKLAQLRALAGRDMCELEVEDIARLRFAKNRIQILKSLPDEVLTEELAVWVSFYDELP